MGRALPPHGSTRRRRGPDHRMSAGGAFSRVSAMDAAEVRFRLRCEARKLAGTFRHAVSPIAFDRRRLARLLDPASGPHVAQAIAEARRGNFLAAHRALAHHFGSRTSRWPLAASRRLALVDAIRGDHPDATRETRRRAD